MSVKIPNFYFSVGLAGIFKFHAFCTIFLLDSGGVDPPFFPNKLKGEGGTGFWKGGRGTPEGENLTASRKDPTLTFIQL